MRRLFTWVAGAAGGLAAYRALTRRRPAPEVAPEAEDPAEELRLKLARARESGETPVEADEPEEADADARRRSVHEQARAALDEMRDET